MSLEKRSRYEEESDLTFENEAGRVMGSVEEIDWDYREVLSRIPLETGFFCYESI